jgi:phage head maturation protease
MRMQDVAVVTFPAYVDAAVAQRSLQAFQAQQPGQSIRWLRMRHTARGGWR